MIEAPRLRLRWKGMGRYLSFGFVGAITLALVFMLAWAVFRLGASSGNELGRYPVNVRPAPDFEVNTYDGGTFRMADQRGKWVVVHFWASWCPSCRAEAPKMEQGWRRWKDKGVVVFLGIDYQDTPEDGKAHIREFDVTYPNGPEPDDISVDFGILGVPETFIIDPDGLIVGRWVGPMKTITIDDMIEEFVGE